MDDRGFHIQRVSVTGADPDSAYLSRGVATPGDGFPDGSASATAYSANAAETAGECNADHLRHQGWPHLRPIGDSDKQREGTGAGGAASQWHPWLGPGREFAGRTERL